MNAWIRRFCFSAATLFAPALAQAGSWMFQPSYYTHTPVQHVQIGRVSAGGPVFTQPTGGYARFGYRQVNSWIQMPNGGGFDQIRYFEVWGDGGRKN